MSDKKHNSLEDISSRSIQEESEGTQENSFVDQSSEMLEQQAFEAAVSNSPEMLEDLTWQNSIYQQEKQTNQTGIPDATKLALEQQTGLDLSEVRVHYNSDKPALVHALAYTEGLNIYLASGAEDYLEHELWHVIQQMRGEVSATEIIGGKQVDTSPTKEIEADEQAQQIQSTTTNETRGPLQQMTITNKVIQRQEITEEAAIEQLEIRAAAFAALPYSINTPYGDNPNETNCHGYTVNQAVDNWIHGEDFLDQIGQTNNVAVFIRDGQIAHSGRYDGNKLTHFLIGIGVVESTIATDGLAGYDARYNLTDDREALDAYLQQVGIDKANMDLAQKIIDRAEAFAKDLGATELCSFYDWQDKTDVQKVTYIQANLDEFNRVRTAYLALDGVEEQLDEFR